MSASCSLVRVARNKTTRLATATLQRHVRFESAVSPATQTSRVQPRQPSAPDPAVLSSPRSSLQNEALSFPCLDDLDSRTAALRSRLNQDVQTPSQTQPQTPTPADSPARSQSPLHRRGTTASSGPEPSYTAGKTKLFRSPHPLLLDWGGVLPGYDIAYETWGTLDASASNAILLGTGLSASSHAASTEMNPAKGWWEAFIGPGKPLDTNRFFVVCTNVLGGCFGSTGPASLMPLPDGAPESSGQQQQQRQQQQRYATRFPILTLQDMVRAQFRLLDHLGIRKLYASVGSSMGGMQSLASAVLAPERVSRVVTISGCARSHPYSIAMRHTQRQVLMNDPAWSSTRGNYYDSIPPHAGMKLAREIATITYRSGPEWEQRFGRRRADPGKPPALCPDFLIETYLDHAGAKWCLEYDANSLLYVSKAMDLFDLGAENMSMLAGIRAANAYKLEQFPGHDGDDGSCNLTLPDLPYEEKESVPPSSGASGEESRARTRAHDASPPQDLIRGLGPVRDIPALVMGVASDILFPAWQQREIADTLRRSGNKNVDYVELGEDRSLFGHDTFLLDIEGVGGEIQRFLG